MTFDFNQEIVLENKQLLIRPMKLDDTTTFQQLLLDPQLSRYSLMHIQSQEDAAQYCTDCLEDRERQKRYPFTILFKESQQIIGTSCWGNIVAPHKRLEIGWTKIIQTFQGTGLNTQIKYLMFEYIFEKLAYNRIELKSHSQNIRSRKAMEKVGAKLEGIFRSQIILQNGQLRDTAYYSLIRPEWPEIKEMLLDKMGY